MPTKKTASKKGATVAKRGKRNKKSLSFNNLLSSRRNILFVLVFAAAGLYLLIQGFAQPTLPTNANDIVAGYITIKPTTISRPSENVLTYESYSTSYLVLADGSLLCDDGNANGVVSTGQLPKGQLSQLHKEISALNISDVPQETGTPADQVILNYEGYILANGNAAKGYAVYPGANKPDKLSEMQAKILKACEKAADKTERGKVKQVNAPRLTATNKNLGDKLLAVLSPTVEAAPTSSVGKFAGDFADYVANATNNYRVSKGLRAYGRVGCLDEVAWTHAKRMLESGTPYHNPNLVNEIVYVCVSKGVTGVTNWTKLGENVGVAYSADSIFNAYVGSAIHNANLLDSSFIYQGSGAWKRNSDAKFFHVHVFGRW